MPHFHIEYSANIEALVDMGHLCDHLRQAAVGIDAFPAAGVRVRAIRVDHYAIADGNPKHGFIDLSVRIRAGRTDDVKRAAIDTVFEALKAFMAPSLNEHSIALSAELRDITAEFAPKYGTIRDHLGETE